MVVTCLGSSTRVTILPWGSTHVATLFTGSEQTRSSIRVTAAVVVVVDADVLVVVCAQATDGNATTLAVTNAALRMCTMYLPLGTASDLRASRTGPVATTLTHIGRWEGPSGSGPAEVSGKLPGDGEDSRACLSAL